MSFFIVVDGHLNKHDFEYLGKSSGRRLDPTLISGKKNTKSKGPIADTNFAIEVMSKTVFSMEIESPVKDALELFKKESIHHLPITKEGALAGLVSDRDVLWLEKFDLTDHSNLDHFMSKTILCCSEDTPIDHLAKVMVKEKISAIPVIDNDSLLVGIVTHHDILRWVYDF